MVDFFDLRLPDDPATCRTAAGSLRSVARTSESAVDFLGTQVRMPQEDFSGGTARGYRAAARALRDDADQAARDVRGIARALDTYADRVDQVRRVLLQVRRRAVSEGLDVDGETIRLPACPRPEQTTAFRLLLGCKNHAHGALIWAERRWESALAEHTDAPRTNTFPFTRPDNWPLGEGDYPFDATVPGVGPGPFRPQDERPDPDSGPDPRLRDPVGPDRTSPVDRGGGPTGPKDDQGPPGPDSEPSPDVDDTDRTGTAPADTQGSGGRDDGGEPPRSSYRPDPEDSLSRRPDSGGVHQAPLPGQAGAHDLTGLIDVTDLVDPHVPHDPAGSAPDPGYQGVLT